MNSCIPRHPFLVYAVVILVLTGAIRPRRGAGWVGDPPGRKSAARLGLTPDGPRSRRNGDAAAAHNRVFDFMKIEYEKYFLSVDRLFQKRLPARRLRELTGPAKLLPVSEGEHTFAYYVLVYMVKAFVESGDRQGLVGAARRALPRSDRMARVSRVLVEVLGQASRGSYPGPGRSVRDVSGSRDSAMFSPPLPAAASPAGDPRERRRGVGHERYAMVREREGAPQPSTMHIFLTKLPMKDSSPSNRTKAIRNTTITRRGAAGSVVPVEDLFVGRRIVINLWRSVLL